MAFNRWWIWMSLASKWIWIDDRMELFCFENDDWDQGESNRSNFFFKN